MFVLMQMLSCDSLGSLHLYHQRKGMFSLLLLGNYHTITVVMTCGASDRSSIVRGVALRKLISEKIGIISEKRCSSNHRAGSGCFLTLCFSEMQELWVCLFLYTIVQR